MNNATIIRQGSGNLIFNVISSIIFLVLMSKLYIPIRPVPITMQTVSVIFIAIHFPLNVSFIAILSYILAGMAGIPVFSDNVWWNFNLLGPSNGYIFGFLASCFTIEYAKKYLTLDKYFHLLLLNIIGTITIFIFGLGFLSILMGFETAIQVGLLPFILPGILKAMFLACIIKYYQNAN